MQIIKAQEWFLFLKRLEPKSCIWMLGGVESVLVLLSVTPQAHLDVNCVWTTPANVASSPALSSWIRHNFSQLQFSEMFHLFLPLTSSIAGLVNNEETVISSHTSSWLFHKGAHSEKSLMAFNSSGPTVCFSLAYVPPLSHETSRHAVHLFSSTVFFNYAGFFS